MRFMHCLCVYCKSLATVGISNPWLRKDSGPRNQRLDLLQINLALGVIHWMLPRRYTWPRPRACDKSIKTSICSSATMGKTQSYSRGHGHGGWKGSSRLLVRKSLGIWNANRLVRGRILAQRCNVRLPIIDLSLSLCEAKILNESLIGRVVDWWPVQAIFCVQSRANLGFICRQQQQHASSNSSSNGDNETN